MPRGDASRLDPAVPGKRGAGGRGGGKQKGSKNRLSALRVSEELKRIAFSDPLDLFDPTKRRLTLRELKAMPKEIRACIAWIRVKTVNLEAGDDKQDEVVEIRLWDKMKALELAAKVTGLIREQPTVQIEHLEILVQKLDAWKKANALDVGGDGGAVIPVERGRDRGDAGD